LLRKNAISAAAAEKARVEAYWRRKASGGDDSRTSVCSVNSITAARQSSV